MLKMLNTKNTTNANNTKKARHSKSLMLKMLYAKNSKR